jgi:hypothetical protein
MSTIFSEKGQILAAAGCYEIQTGRTTIKKCGGILY